MKEQTMKETTLKVKNQTTTLQKAIIWDDIVFNDWNPFQYFMQTY